MQRVARHLLLLIFWAGMASLLSYATWWFVAKHFSAYREALALVTPSIPLQQRGLRGALFFPIPIAPSLTLTDLEALALVLVLSTCAFLVMLESAATFTLIQDLAFYRRTGDATLAHSVYQHLIRAAVILSITAIAVYFALRWEDAVFAYAAAIRTSGALGAHGMLRSDGHQASLAGCWWLLGTAALFLCLRYVFRRIGSRWQLFLDSVHSLFGRADGPGAAGTGAAG
jgi:hypothetical protein